MRTLMLSRFSLGDTMLRDSAGGGAAGGGAADGGAAAGGTAGGGEKLPPPGNANSGGEWFGAAEFGFDDATRQFFAGKKYPDVKTALQSLPEADRMARDRNVIGKPDPKKPSEWGHFTELGYIEDAGKYAAAIEKPKPEAGHFDEAIFNSTVSAAHKYKLAPWQTQGVYNDVQQAMNKIIDDAETSAQGELQKLETALRGKWGTEYDRKSEMAKRAMKISGIGGQDAALLDKAMGSPALVEFFHGYAELLGEDRLVGGDSGGGGLPASIDGLRAELDKLHGNAEFMKKFRDNRHPEHQAATAQRQRIIDKIAKAEGKAKSN